MSEIIFSFSAYFFFKNKASLTDILTILKDLKLAKQDSMSNIIQLLIKNNDLYRQLCGLNIYSGISSKNNTRQLISGSTESTASLKTSIKQKPLVEFGSQTFNLIEKQYTGKRFVFTIDDLIDKQIELDQNASFRFMKFKIKDPFDFFVQVVGDYDEEYMIMHKNIDQFYNENEKDLQAFAEKVNYDFIKINGLCVCKVKAVDHYYRCQIKSIEKLHYLVFFIDFGDYNKVQKSDMFPINEKFLRLAQRVVSCQLDAIEPVEKNGWSFKSIEAFKKLLLTDKVYKAVVSEAASREVLKFKLEKSWSVTIENDIDSGVDSSSLNDILVSQGYANYFQTDINDPVDELHESVSMIKGSASQFNDYKGSTSEAILSPFPIQESEEQSVKEYKKVHILKLIQDSEKFEINLKNQQQNYLFSDKMDLKMNTSNVDENNNLKSTENSNKPKLHVTIPELENYNPIRNDYESVRNAYGCNQDNFEQMRYGYGRKVFLSFYF